MRHSPWGCIRNGGRYAVCGRGGPGSHGQHGLAAVATAGSGAVVLRAQRDAPPVGHVAHRHRPLRTARNHCRSALGSVISGCSLESSSSSSSAASSALNPGRTEAKQKNSGLCSFCQRIHASMPTRYTLCMQPLGHETQQLDSRSV